MTNKATEIVKDILVNYSCPKYEETICRTKDLERDLVSIVDKLLRERDSIEEIHNAWLRMQGRLFA